MNQPTSTPTHHSEIILHERVRQARKSFDLAYAMTAFSAAIGLTGAVLMFSGQVPAGLITTTGSTSLTICGLRLAKDANDRLDKLATDADDNEEK